MLVLDDTDKWHTDERLAHGRAFFDATARSLIDLDVPVVAHAHPRYFEGHPALDWFDLTVAVPTIDGAGMERIIDHRIHVATEDGHDIDAVWEPAAVERLVSWFDNGDASIRRAISVAGDSLVEAVEAATNRITVGAVENALSLR